MRASAHKFSQKVIGEAGVRLASTLFVLLLARTIGPGSFGLYSTAMAYAAFCAVFVDLGTNSILTREIARRPQDRVLIAQTSQLLKLITSVISWLLLWGVTYLLHFAPSERFLTLCLGIAVIGYTLTDYFAALLSGIEEMGWEALMKVLSRILALSLAFAALVRHQPLQAIAVQMAIGAFIAYAAASAIVSYRFHFFGVSWDKAFLVFLMRSCLPLFGSIIFAVLYDSQDILLLNYFHFLPRDIGYFAAAMKIIEVVRVYPILVLGVFFPTLSKLHLSDRDAFDSKRKRVFQFMFFSLLLLAIALYVCSPWIIRLLYASDYLPSAFYLKLLAAALVLMGLNHAQGQFLIALNRERVLLGGALLACGVNLLLACLLLPHLGVAGICYALAGSELVYFLFLRHTIAVSS